MLTASGQSPVKNEIKIDCKVIKKYFLTSHSISHLIDKYINIH